MLTFSTARLEKMPPARAGDPVPCPACGGTHTLLPAAQFPAAKNLSLQFRHTGQSYDMPHPEILVYACRGNLYVGSIAGRSIVGQRPDSFTTENYANA